MPITSTFSAGSLPLFLSIFITSSSAAPLPTFFKRDNIPTGAQAGLGIGIAVAAVIILLIALFFFLHVRRNSRNTAALDKQRAILEAEKNDDGSDKSAKFVTTNEPQVTTIPRRNMSVRDRLMGPLYRESMSMPRIPEGARTAAGSKRVSGIIIPDAESFLSRPWAGGESSPRPSFSSKRATRMMMMM